MKLNRLMAFILGLSLIMMSVNAGFAQQQTQGKDPEGKAPESATVFVIGRIEYLQSEGGYFIQGDHPYGKRFKIANQDPEVLEKLLKTRDKHVTIEGHWTGTNLLFIEKIWGQPYQGAKEPASK